MSPPRFKVSMQFARIASGEPYAGMISGRLPLVWAQAQAVCDSPDKKQVENGTSAGRLMNRPVADSARAVQSELLMVTPYFVPVEEEQQLLQGLRQRKVRVRILSNSLESNPDPVAQSGYRRFRTPLLKDGVELHEIRSLLGNVRGSGQTARLSRYGNYALHAKLFVFDRRKRERARQWFHHHFEQAANGSELILRQQIEQRVSLLAFRSHVVYRARS